MRFLNRVFLLLSLFASISGADALATKQAKYPTQFKNNQVHAFSAKAFLLIGHATRQWDGPEVSKNGVIELVRFAKENGIPSIGFISEASQFHDEFYQPQDVNFLADSFSGTHRFHFPDSRLFIIAGGNFSYCLCELIRDTISGVSKSLDTVSFIFISDAIYNPMGHWPPELGPRSVQLTPEQQAQPWFTPTFTLSEILKNGKPKTMASYLNQEVIGGKKRFCPNQNTFDTPELDKSKYKFVLFSWAGKPIGTVGNGNKEIHFYFSESSELQNNLKKWGLGQ
jgi:hypothetical protein